MIKRNRPLYKIFTTKWLLTLTLLVLQGTVDAQSVKDKEKLQHTKQQLEQEIRYTTELLEKTQKNKQSSLNSLQILAKRIKSREALINTINHELNDVQVEISVENIQIDRLSKQMQEMKTEYARMICNAYRIMNGHSKLMFIFSAKDFNQAYSV